MCQLLTVTVENNKKNIENCVFNRWNKINRLLNEKGGESYSLTAINTSTNEVIIEYCFDKSEFDDSWDKFSKTVLKKSEKWDKESEIAFIFFSRQAPEMEHESDDVKPAPYLENNKYVWMHGTISNVSEIEKALNKKFIVDTQAIAYYDELLEKNIIIKGVFEAVIYDLKLNTLKWFHNGIGYWSFPIVCEDNDIIWEGTTANINTLKSQYCIFTPMLRPESDYPQHYYENIFDENNKTKAHYYVAFSGGMDIVMSAYVNISDRVTRIDGDLMLFYGKTIIFDLERKYIFVYFDYGAKARDHEIAAMKKFYELVKNEFPQIEFEYRIIDVKDLFKAISKISNYQSKLTDVNSVGDTRETESNLAYVPYRNTEFALLLGSIIDNDLEEKLFLPFIIYGLNLTELSVYVDNTYAWVQSVEDTISYGGKSYKNVKIITPFINLTKTNMLVYMLKNYGYDKTKKLLDISFSCYYPDENGNPCGKCGSCILRKKAFERATEIVRKKFFKGYKK